jgi:hypothetical protein
LLVFIPVMFIAALHVRLFLCPRHVLDEAA